MGLLSNYEGAGLPGSLPIQIVASSATVLLAGRAADHR